MEGVQAIGNGLIRNQGLNYLILCKFFNHNNEKDEVGAKKDEIEAAGIHRKNERVKFIY